MGACSGGGALGPGGDDPAGLQDSTPPPSTPEVMPPVSIPAPSLKAVDADLVLTASAGQTGIVPVVGSAGSIEGAYRSQYNVALSLSPLGESAFSPKKLWHASQQWTRQWSLIPQAHATALDFVPPQKKKDSTELLPPALLLKGPVCQQEGVVCCPIEADGSFECSIEASNEEAIYLYLTDGFRVSEAYATKPDPLLTWMPSSKENDEDIVAEAPLYQSEGMIEGVPSAVCTKPAHDVAFDPLTLQVALLHRQEGLYLCQQGNLIQHIQLAQVDHYQRVFGTKSGAFYLLATVNEDPQGPHEKIFEVSDPVKAVGIPAGMSMDAGDIQALEVDDNKTLLLLVKRNGGVSLVIVEQGGGAIEVLWPQFETSNQGTPLRVITSPTANEVGYVMALDKRGFLWGMPYALGSFQNPQALFSAASIPLGKQALDFKMNGDRSKGFVLMEDGVFVLQLKEQGQLAEDLLTPQAFLTFEDHLKNYKKFNPHPAGFEIIDSPQGPQVWVLFSGLGLLTLDPANAVSLADLEGQPESILESDLPQDNQGSQGNGPGNKGNGPKQADEEVDAQIPLPNVGMGEATPLGEEASSEPQEENQNQVKNKKGPKGKQNKNE